MNAAVSDAHVAYAKAGAISATSSALSVLPPVADLSIDIEAGDKHVLRNMQSGSTGGLRIMFKDLTFKVQSSTEKGVELSLLSGVNGYFEPYQMAALMGPSGSGKTTLLDLLAGRKTVGRLEGRLSFGGQKPSPAFLRRYTGYVEQFDTLLSTLTVEEMLMYTAELKRPLSQSKESKEAAVESLLHKLALTSCRNVVIGDPLTKGISGGQAKRVNIGIALITNPRVLFLDEPTSGLDSYTSNEVMKVVKALAQDGTTICATIHSPTATTFALFDSVLMLTRGRVVYFGEQGAPALDFARLAWTNVAPPSSKDSDAEYLVSVITEADRRGETGLMADAYNSSSLKKANDAALDRMMREKSELSADVVKELAVTNATSTPWWWGVGVLLRYRSARNYKNPAWLGPRIADKLLVTLIILTLYLRIGHDYKRSNLINIQSALFMWCLLPAFGAASYVPAIVLERSLFLRERADGLYSVATYLIAKLVEEIFLALLITIGFSLYVYYGVNLQGQWVLFWLVYFIDLSVGIVLAYLVAAISPNMDVANAALPAFVVTLLFFAGQLCTFDAIPRWWGWYSRIDFLRYAWSALMTNQFEAEQPNFTDDQDILSYYSLDGVDKWAQVGYLALFFPVFTMLAYLALAYVKHQKR